MSTPIQNNGNELSAIIETLNNIPEKKYAKGTFNVSTDGYAEINLGWTPDIFTIEMGYVFINDETPATISHTINFMHQVVYPQAWFARSAQPEYAFMSGTAGLFENGIIIYMTLFDEAYNQLDPNGITFNYTAFKFL